MASTRFPRFHAVTLLAFVPLVTRVFAPSLGSDWEVHFLIITALASAFHYMVTVVCVIDGMLQLCPSCFLFRIPPEHYSRD